MTTPSGPAAVQPLRLRDPRGPLPHLRPPARRGPPLPQRRARLLGAVAPRGRPRRLPQPGALLEPLRRLPRPRRLRPRRPPGHVLSGHGPARHTRMRSLVSKAFTPRRVAELEDGVRELAVEHLEPALERGAFDFVADFAGKAAHGRDLRDDRGARRPTGPSSGGWPICSCTGSRGSTTSRPKGHGGGLRHGRLLRGDGRRAPAPARRDDLTSALLEADLDGDRLIDDEIISFLFLMVVAGNETTTKLLGNAWYWGWRFPDERAKPLADPGRIPDWVEETLRFDTSTQMLLRVTRGDVELHGHVLPDGERVLLLVGSANRDAAVFDRPRPLRHRPRHLEAGQLRQRPPLLPGGRPGPPGGPGRPGGAAAAGRRLRHRPGRRRAGALHQRPGLRHASRSRSRLR